MSCLSYLPGDLARYLSDPVNGPLGCDLNEMHLLKLREYVALGYYRQEPFNKRVRCICRCREEAELVADIFCAILPYEDRVVRKVGKFIVVKPYREEVAVLCVSRFNPGAFRAFCAPYDREAIRSLDRELFALHEHFPGYIEALMVWDWLIAEFGLAHHSLPKTYDGLARDSPIDRRVEVYAYSAVCARNYRLAKHLRSRHPHTNFRIFAISCLRGEKRNEEKIAWLVDNGWVTPEDV